MPVNKAKFLKKNELKVDLIEALTLLYEATGYGRKYHSCSFCYGDRRSYHNKCKPSCKAGKLLEKHKSLLPNI